VATAQRWPGGNGVREAGGAPVRAARFVEPLCYDARMRVLGLDVGERRIGVALSDPEGRLAFPLLTHERRGQEDAAALAALAREQEAERVVVGLPLSMDGTRGAQAEYSVSFAEALAACGVEVVLWDERLSSREADFYLRASAPAGSRGASRKARTGREQQKGARDQIAAAIILQAYLDSQRSGAAL
jgi:putative Holliday junction resolvase